MSTSTTDEEMVALKAELAKAQELVHWLVDQSLENAANWSKGERSLMAVMDDLKELGSLRKEVEELHVQRDDLVEGEQAAGLEIEQLKKERDKAEFFEKKQSDKCMNLQRSLHKKDIELKGLRDIGRQVIATATETVEISEVEIERRSELIELLGKLERTVDDED